MHHGGKVMRAKGKYYLATILVSLLLSLLVSITRSEQFGLAFVNSLFLVALSLVCIGILSILLQRGAFNLVITSFRKFFKNSDKLGSYVLEQDFDRPAEVKERTGWGRILFISGAILVALSSLVSFYYI